MFYSDKPIKDSRHDLLGRNNFSKLLAQTLINLSCEDTYTVGLFGKWGNGKTSVINMMLQELKNIQNNAPLEDNVIVIHFEPWNFSDTNQLLSQFFIRLSNEFMSKGDKKLFKAGKAIEEYAGAFELDNVIPIAGALMSFLGKKMQKRHGDRDISKQKDNVIGLLKKQKNRILIVIDDIDRLSNEQIRQVFQLVTSVAKFPNTIYLLAFDKEIVTKALAGVQEGWGEDYLEKIIQMPIQIPDIQKDKLRKVLFERLGEIVKNNKGEVIFLESYWQKMFGECIEPFVKTIRDINRLCNTVQFKLTTMGMEVDFTDLVAITALEIACPSVYEWIKANKCILTGKDDLSFLPSQEKTPEEWSEIYEKQILLLLQNTKISKNDTVLLEVIMKCLTKMFPHFSKKIEKVQLFDDMSNMNLLRSNNHIAHPEKFDRYFHLDIDSIGLKKSEILNAVNNFSEISLTKFMIDCDKRGESYEFLEEVRAIISDMSLERCKLLAKVFIDISCRLDSSREFLSLSCNGYSKYVIIDLIERQEPSERLYFIVHILNVGNLDAVQTIASIINIIELAYGRLAANGVEKNYKKIITLDELISLENIFLGKIKQILEQRSLFEFREWREIYYLIECFDLDYAKQYLKNALNVDQNILQYLDGVVITWTGSGTSYEVNDNYKKYLTQERILCAIENQKITGALFLLAESLQYKCVAFYLKSIGEADNIGNVAQARVDKMLDEWKESYYNKIKD